MPNLDLFLEKHQDEASQEIKNYAESLKQANRYLCQLDYRKAAICHENISKSLHELQKFRNEKLAHDQAIELINKAGLRAFKGVMKD